MQPAPGTAGIGRWGHNVSRSLKLYLVAYPQWRSARIHIVSPAACGAWRRGELLGWKPLPGCWGSTPRRQAACPPEQGTHSRGLTGHPTGGARLDPRLAQRPRRWVRQVIATIFRPAIDTGLPARTDKVYPAEDAAGTNWTLPVSPQSPSIRGMEPSIPASLGWRHDSKRDEKAGRARVGSVGPDGTRDRDSKRLRFQVSGGTTAGSPSAFVQRSGCPPATIRPG